MTSNAECLEINRLFAWINIIQRSALLIMIIWYLKHALWKKKWKCNFHPQISLLGLNYSLKLQSQNEIPVIYEALCDFRGEGETVPRKFNHFLFCVVKFSVYCPCFPHSCCNPLYLWWLILKVKLLIETFYQTWLIRKCHKRSIASH